MFFKSKPKGYLVDHGEHVSLVARYSDEGGPLVLEALEEFTFGDAAGCKKVLDKICAGKRTAYLHANCGISPESRFIRRATIDPKKAKETGYFSELVSSQFRIDPDHHLIATLNAYDGRDFDPSLPNPEKEVIFCGLTIEAAATAQQKLLKFGVFPESLELASVAAVAGVVDYLRFSDSAKPTLILEFGNESTQSYIVSARGLEASRPIAVGLEAMVPVVQKELGLKDEDSARKLFFSNTFDFTGMGASLCKRLLKELHSFMGFYEVQTGQSIGQLICVVLPAKLTWLEAVIASQLGVQVLEPKFNEWLGSRQVSFFKDLNISLFDARKMTLLGLMLKFTTPKDDHVD